MQIKITLDDGREVVATAEARGYWVAVIYKGITVGEAENLRDAVRDARKTLNEFVN